MSAGRRSARRLLSFGLLIAAVAGGGCEASPAGPPPAASWLSREALHGREVFLEGTRPHCSVCHTLREAGADGTLGPDLDALAPSRNRVRRVVRRGIGLMPPQADHLAEDDLEALAIYVEEATRPRR